MGMRPLAPVLCTVTLRNPSGTLWAPRLTFTASDLNTEHSSAVRATKLASAMAGTAMRPHLGKANNVYEQTL